MEVTEGLKSIPAVLRQRRGYTLNKLPVYCMATWRLTTIHAHIQPYSQRRGARSPLDCARKQQVLREASQTQGEHANSPKKKKIGLGIGPARLNTRCCSLNNIQPWKRKSHLFIYFFLARLLSAKCWSASSVLHFDCISRMKIYSGCFSSVAHCCAYFHVIWTQIYARSPS